MDRTVGILTILLPVVILPMLGALCRVTGVLRREGVQGLQSFCMNIALPAVLFGAFWRNSPALGSLFMPLLLFAAVVAGIYLGKLYCRVSGLRVRFSEFLMGGYEVGMLGYALFTVLFGESGIPPLALYDIGHTLAVFTVYMILVKRRAGERQTARETAKKLFTSPILLAILLGLFFGVSGLGARIGQTPAGTVIDSVLDFAAAPIGAVILVTIGWHLSFHGAGGRGLWKAVFGRLIISVLLCLAVLLSVRLVSGRLDGPALWAAVMIFILPPPYVLPVMAAGTEEEPFLASAISVYTVASLLAFAVMAVLAV